MRELDKQKELDRLIKNILTQILYLKILKNIIKVKSL